MLAKAAVKANCNSSVALLLRSSSPFMKVANHIRSQIMVTPTYMKKVRECLTCSSIMLVTYRRYVNDYFSRIVRSSRLNVNRHEQCCRSATYCPYTEEGLYQPESKLARPFSVNVVKPSS
jgi:hypothetical protein